MWKILKDEVIRIELSKAKEILEILDPKIINYFTELFHAIEITLSRNPTASYVFEQIWYATLFSNVCHKVFKNKFP